MEPPEQPQTEYGAEVVGFAETLLGILRGKTADSVKLITCSIVFDEGALDTSRTLYVKINPEHFQYLPQWANEVEYLKQFGWAMLFDQAKTAAEQALQEEEGAEDDD